MGPSSSGCRSRSESGRDETALTSQEGGVMKAAVFKGKGVLEVEEVPTPTPGQGQVLVKVKYCAICGSDVHRGFIFGMMTPGTVMGHEYCGTVAQLGDGVTEWKVGDRVVGGGGTPPPDVAARP